MSRGKPAKKTARAPSLGREARILAACVRVLGDTPRAHAFASAVQSLHAEPTPPHARTAAEVELARSIAEVHRSVDDLAERVRMREAREAKERAAILAAAQALRQTIHDCGAHHLDAAGQLVEVDGVDLLDESTGDFVPVGRRFVPREFLSMLSVLVDALDDRKRQRGRPPGSGKAARKLLMFMSMWNDVVQEPIAHEGDGLFRDALREIAPHATGIAYDALKKAFQRMANDGWAMPKHWITGEQRKSPRLPDMMTLFGEEPGQK